MQVLAIASAGLQLAQRRFDESAQRTAQAGSPYADVDMAAEAVEQISARSAFSANVSVIRAANQMMGELLDLMV